MKFEDTLKEAMGEAMIKMLRDKHSVIKQMVSNIQQALTIAEGTERMTRQLDNPDNEGKINMEKVLRATLRSSAKLARITHALTILLLVYVVEGDFDKSAAMMATRFGNGQDALKTILENKLKGKR